LRIRQLGQLGGFQRKGSVIGSRTVAHLPIAVHLVAQAPVFHLPGLVAAVPLAHLHHGGVLVAVDILDPLLRIGPAAGPQIEADIGFCAHLLDVIHEFMRAEAIVLDRAPGHFQA